jgi:hypothetical protein
MHRPSQRDIMFSRFKPQPHQTAAAAPRGRSNSGPSSPQNNKRPAVLIQRLIILHDGLMPLPDGQDENDHLDMKNKDTGEKLPVTNQRAIRRNPQAVLSEDASLEEHGEFILYYYNHSLHATVGNGEERPFKRGNSSGSRSTVSSHDDIKADHCTEGAVKFAGMCRALRSLPLSLQPQHSSSNTIECEDETEVVHLSDSTLVFVPLELNGDVIAVVQIPRASNQRQVQSNQQSNPNHLKQRLCAGYGADPTAIREAVRRSHVLFSMMNGGGIHRRLLRTKHLEKSDDWLLEESGSPSDIFSGTDNRRLSVSSSEASSYCYGGMKELFELRRENRKLDRGNDEARMMGRSSWRRKSNPLDAFDDIADQMGRIACQDRIESLLQILPITSLRSDIKTYYDDWVTMMQGMCAIIEGGVGRSIVELVPTPMRQNNNARGQYPPISPAPFVCLAAAEFMRSLLSEEICTKSKLFQLAGLSFFYRNRYVVSQFSSAGDLDDASLPSEIVCTIAEYLDSHQKKRLSDDSKRVSSPVTSQNGTHVHNPLDRWLSNISSGSSKSDSAKGNVSPSSFFSISGHTTNHSSQYEAKGFVTPHASDDQAADSVFVWDLKSEAWLPCLFIPPMTNESLECSHDDSNTETPVTLFKHGDFSFLLCFNGHYSDEKFASEMLSLLADRISGFCDEYSATEHKSGPVVDFHSKQIINENTFLGEPGMDIIFVDREDNTFLLLSHHDLSSNDFHRKTNTTSLNDNMTKGGIFGLGFKIKENCERENDSTSFIRSSHYTNKLDCRHKLAAYLPLDVMLAFDDMFNEIGRLGRRKNILETSQLNSDEVQANRKVNRNTTIELCTYLPQGWVYGRAFKSLELYVLLDTSKFVTISDVTKAVMSLL